MRPERHLSILAIILLNAAVFAWEQSRETDFAFDYGATPASISDAARALVDGNLNSEVAQKLSTLLTAMFLHGDVAHILYNMVFLWAFGYLTSEHLGQWWALAAFVFCGVCGNIAQVCLNLESPFPIIGASGAVCGFEGIYLGLALRWALPWPDVWPLAHPVPPRQLAAFAVVGFVIDMVLLTNHDQQIAYGAHVGGFLSGLAIAAIVTTVFPTLAAYWRTG